MEITHKLFIETAHVWIMNQGIGLSSNSSWFNLQYRFFGGHDYVSEDPQ